MARQSRTGPPRTLDLGDLRLGLGNVTAACGASFAEQGAVCLHSNDHSQGCPFEVSGDSKATFALKWPDVSEAMVQCYGDLPDAAENGAYGVAFLLMKRLRGLSVVQKSYKGPGFDYWLGIPPPSGLPFEKDVKLEVSGIVRGTPARLSSRVKGKVEQVTRGGRDEIPAVVVVVDFGRPQARIVDA